MSEVIWNRPERAVATLVLAHGAGAPMDSDFMNDMAALLAERGIAAMRFEFPYMQKRRATGRKSPPDRPPKLLASFREALEMAGEPGKLFIGGKSLGGRMASMLATEVPVRGVVCLGYPFHPPGKPERTRLEHLPEMKAPMLICQGERDPFGTPSEVGAWELPQGIELYWLADGDHGLKPRKRSGVTLEENLERAADRIVAFCSEKN